MTSDSTYTMVARGCARAAKATGLTVPQPYTRINFKLVRHKVVRGNFGVTLVEELTNWSRNFVYWTIGHYVTEWRRAL